jgi:predicted HTH transcriptional regulator
MRENPQITNAELSKVLGLTEKGIEWNIKKLKEKASSDELGRPREDIGKS